jgi:hypothetical protein
MTDIRRQLDQVVSKELIRNIIPVKTDAGILVGDILIVSDGVIKHLYRHKECLYNNISLNAAAVRMANILARHRSHTLADKIHRADQEYGRWFTESQIMLQKHHSANKNKDYERADTLWAKYIESKERARSAKNTVIGLTLL